MSNSKTQRRSSGKKKVVTNVIQVVITLEAPKNVIAVQAKTHIQQNI